MIYIYHHLGLGDHIVCNGLVRYLHEKHGFETTLFAYHHNKQSVEYMYRDLSGLTVTGMSGDGEIDRQISGIQNVVYKIGFSDMSKWYGSCSFDEAFYKIADIPFNVRFDNFKIQRDKDREDEIFKILNPDNLEYIFVHDDPQRGFRIDQSRHRDDLLIIRNDKRFNIFEMMGVYERATEIHFMESSISALLNGIRLTKPNFYLHKYVRGYDDFGHTKSLNNITVLN